MTKYMGYELHFCKPFGGIVYHGYARKHAPQVDCFYWQIRLNGKLIDTALTEEKAKDRVCQHFLMCLEVVAYS